MANLSMLTSYGLAKAFSPLAQTSVFSGKSVWAISGYRDIPHLSLDVVYIYVCLSHRTVTQSSNLIRFTDARLLLKCHQYEQTVMQRTDAALYSECCSKQFKTEHEI